MTPKAYSYVRMSTDAQLKGDSLRRQLEASTAYANTHGLELIDERRLADIGVSGFQGRNITDGALGKFLQAVNIGKVERGSYLLVESLDRLSRQNPFEAFDLFSKIIKAGINIVTLTDNRVYSSAPDLGDLITSLVTMSRAHEESHTKSVRGRAAWANKRTKAKEQPLTARCPGWLTFDKKTKSLSLINSERISSEGFLTKVHPASEHQSSSNV